MTWGHTCARDSSSPVSESSSVYVSPCVASVAGDDVEEALAHVTLGNVGDLDPKESPARRGCVPNQKPGPRLGNVGVKSANVGDRDGRV